MSLIDFAGGGNGMTPLGGGSYLVNPPPAGSSAPDANLGIALGNVGPLATEINRQSLDTSRKQMDTLAPGYGDLLKGSIGVLKNYLGGGLASNDISQIRQYAAERNPGQAGQYGFKLMGDELTRRREYAMNQAMPLFGASLNATFMNTKNTLDLLEAAYSRDFQLEMFAKNQSVANSYADRMQNIARQGMGGTAPGNNANPSAMSPFRIGGGSGSGSSSIQRMGEVGHDWVQNQTQNQLERDAQNQRDQIWNYMNTVQDTSTPDYRDANYMTPIEQRPVNLAESLDPFASDQTFDFNLTPFTG